ncbi:ATP-binding protein [Candidatus Solincola sp.]|nr:ATP-binding protein [Actinomycetota bacterium]MDI7251834.1 ATP-binding protein [Actinomycetota bacterium]
MEKPDTKPAIWVLTEDRYFVEEVRSSLQKSGVEAHLLVFAPDDYSKIGTFKGKLPLLLLVDTSTVDLEHISPPVRKDIIIIPLSRPDPVSMRIFLANAENYREMKAELAASRESLSRLNSVIRALDRPLDDAQVLPSAIREVGLIFDSRHLVMLSPSEGNGLWRLIHQQGVDNTVIRTLMSPPGQSILRKVFEGMLSIVDILDKTLLLHLDPGAREWSRFLDITGNGGEGDFLLLTLKGNRRPVGLLIMSFTENRVWHSRDKECLSIIGFQLGLTLDNLQLFESVRTAWQDWQTTVDSMRDMVLQAGPKGLVRRANRALVEFLGIKPEEIIGKPISEILQRGWKTNGLQLDQMLCGRLDSFELEDGNGRSYRALVTSYCADREGATGTVFVIRDITEEKAIIRLEEEKRQLEELNRLKNRFMASVTHELKTPLNAVIGFSELLMSGAYGEINDDQRKYLENIYTSGKHLLSLISDILDYTQAQAGHLSLQLEDTETESLLVSTLELMRREADRRGIELSLKMEDPPARVTADSRRLRQIILNLLSNALKFTPSGGSVLLRATSADGELLVEVSDTGIGIKPEDREKLFHEFSQVGEAAHAVGGTGLGLALSKQLVELHGGRIWMTSEFGKGTTFSFTIPARPAEKANDGNSTLGKKGR